MKSHWVPQHLCYLNSYSDRSIYKTQSFKNTKDLGSAIKAVPPLISLM